MRLEQRLDIANKYFPRALAAKKKIDIVRLSEGQALLSLIDRRADLQMAYTGDPTGEYQRAKNMIFQAVQDLHGVRPSFTGRLSGIEQAVASYITAARRKTRNFSTNNVTRNIGAGFTVDFECNQLAHDKTRTKVSDRVYEDFIDSDPFDQPPRLLPGYQTYVNIFDAERNECTKASNLSEILNDRFEESAPQFMYDFITGRQIGAGTQSLITFKTQTQKNALDQIANLGGDYLSRDLMREWTYNGILAQNIGSGAGDITPQETIDILIQAGRGYQDHVGEIQLVDPNHPNLSQGLTGAPLLGLTGAEIVAIIKIIGFILASIITTIALVDQMKQNRLVLDQRLDAVGLPSVSPDAIDWFGTDNPQTQADNASAGIAIIAAIAALFFGPKLLK